MLREITIFDKIKASILVGVAAPILAFGDARKEVALFLVQIFLPYVSAPFGGHRSRVAILRRMFFKNRFAGEVAPSPKSKKEVILWPSFWKPLA
ncbi:MAG TPA: hypothetical protein IAB21_03420 [Candidatus Avelusimicrobium excrementipullorum]|nr:hypothetical protein [Candidatus Avelusimicrobium excrementipullorum]